MIIHLNSKTLYIIIIERYRNKLKMSNLKRYDSTPTKKTNYDD
jgi:hypothetical protein